MEVFKVSHLPLINEDEYIALISDKDIYDNELTDSPLGCKKLSLISPYVTSNQHIFEIAEIVSRFKVTTIPVLTQNGKYMGTITLNNLAMKICDYTASQGPGGIIVLAVGPYDYSLTQIAQIVEGNDAKILNLYVKSVPNSQELNITLKINQTELSPIIQTFTRYDYNIKAVYTNDSSFNNLYNDRFEEFMKFLNI
ncbi:MAG: CBS domain-containing protein [Bacteroidota bacterium]|nr:CBS domain-containing protein [Bacteroidota bacterium]